jgi:hypothetical protein
MEPMHIGAMPVILTTPAEIGSAAEVLALQKPAWRAAFDAEFRRHLGTT